MKSSFKSRMRYRFDNFMAQGTPALIGGLALLSLIFISIMAVLINLTGVVQPGGERLSFFEAAWQSLMRTLDAGTMGGDEGWGYRLMMLIVTLGGVFIISTLIGLLTSGIEVKMENLRKGRSQVLESGHTVILGWSEQIFTILSEITAANDNHKRSCIVVLADKDKVEMEDEIREKLGKDAHTAIVCRSGIPIDLNDLDRASVQTSKAIVILRPDGEDPDAETIKTILAVTNNPHRRSQPYHIVAEICDEKNLEIARLVGKDEVELILTDHLISRIIAQTCRQSGLSIVYSDLLDYGGNEIYFKFEPALVGKTFGEALMAYDTSAVLGVFNPARGARLNPPMDTIIGPDDQIVAVSEDDDTLLLYKGTPQFQPELIVSRPHLMHAAEKTLILGWNARAPFIINELDQYVSPGSVVKVVANCVEGAAELARWCCALKNIQVEFEERETTDRRELDALAPQTYGQVVVLAYSDTLNIQEADARTLMTLLHLRDIATRTGSKFVIVSEMLDLQNRNLAEVTHADDFIVSDRLISLLFAQISENKYLNAVFNDIFDPEGSEIYLKPVDRYIQPGQPVNFFTVVQAAAAQGEVAFGYRIAADAADVNRAYGIILNPDKHTPVTFSPQDRLILLAEQ